MIFFLFHNSHSLFDDYFHGFSTTFHNVNALLRLIEATALQVVVFRLPIAYSIEMIDGCRLVADTDVQRFGAYSFRIVNKVSTERLAGHFCGLFVLQQFSRIHQHVALHDEAVAIRILVELLLLIDTHKLVVVVLSSRG